MANILAYIEVGRLPGCSLVYKLKFADQAKGKWSWNFPEVQNCLKAANMDCARNQIVAFPLKACGIWGFIPLAFVKCHRTSLAHGCLACTQHHDHVPTNMAGNCANIQEITSRNGINNSNSSTFALCELLVVIHPCVLHPTGLANICNLERNESCFPLCSDLAAVLNSYRWSFLEHSVLWRSSFSPSSLLAGLALGFLTLL